MGSITPWIAVALALILSTGLPSLGHAAPRSTAARSAAAAPTQTSSAVRRLRTFGRVSKVLAYHVPGVRMRSTWLSSLKPEETPVLMIHGLTSNPGVWRGLIGHLRAEGRSNLGVVNYYPTRQDVDTILREVDAMVRSARMAGHPKVALVGHSLGGVVAALYAEAHPEHVAQIVAIASPLRPFDAHGKLDPGIERYAGVVTRNGDVLRRLGQSTLVENVGKSMDPIETGKVLPLIDGKTAIPVLSIVGQRDSFATAANSRASGRGNRTEVVADDGHVSIAADPVVHRLVFQALRR